MKAFHTLVALLGAPTAWLAQMMLSAILASHSCYPHRVPLPAPQWPDMLAAIWVINIVCLIGGLLSCYAAWRAWQRVRRESSKGGEHAIEVGESRAGFLVMFSALSSVTFMVAIVFTGCAILLVAPCSSWF